MPIWSDSLLSQLSSDAELEIVSQVDCIFHRFCLATTIGVSVYTLPGFINGIKSISWRGRKLEPASWEELTLLSPATAVVSEGAGPSYPAVGIETSVSKPLWYAMHPTNIFDVRFYPCPNESFSSSAEPPYSPSPNAASCIVTCTRNPDTSFTDPTLLLPSYIDRRTRKAYVLWKAFEKDGKGQNANAAAFYKAKFEFLIAQFKRINEGAFVAKRYSIDDGLEVIDNFRYPRPQLPSNFERVFY